MEESVTFVNGNDLSPQLGIRAGHGTSCFSHDDVQLSVGFMKWIGRRRQLTSSHGSSASARVRAPLEMDESSPAFGHVPHQTVRDLIPQTDHFQARMPALHACMYLRGMPPCANRMSAEHMHRVGKSVCIWLSKPFNSEKTCLSSIWRQKLNLSHDASKLIGAGRFA